MSELEPGIYRGMAAGCFGLFRLTRSGQWLFSMPVEGADWRRAMAEPHPDLLVLIAPDTEEGKR